MSIKDEIKVFLDKSMDKFDEVVNNIQEEDLNVQIHDKEGGWSVIEILRHIQNSERGMINSIKSTLAGHGGTPSDFDLQRYNTRSNEKMLEMTFDEVKSNMKKYRENTLKVLESTKDDDMSKIGRHPNLKDYTVKQAFEIISWHQHSHMKGIIEKFNF